ncbi:MAG: 6-carboxytetrahydropterin synthase [Fimbriimonas sp.]
MVRMTRRVTFSAGHRFWNPKLDLEGNRAIFREDASPYNHGHNYVLDVTTAGEVDPRTGMIVNIKVIDDVLKAHVLARYHQKSLNDEVPAFFETPPTVEKLLLDIAGILQEPRRLPGEVSSTGLRLEETPLTYAELDLEKSLMTLTRTYEFAASHRLHAPVLSTDENVALFGKCNNPNGHGHNYVLEVTVAGSPDPITGQLVARKELDEVVAREVVDRYDHKNLSVDIPEFEGINATSEVVAQVIFDRLAGKVPASLHRVRLHETARNIFEVTA